jgi:hypothetical protein
MQTRHLQNVCGMTMTLGLINKVNAAVLTELL